MDCGEVLFINGVQRVCVEERYTEHSHEDYPATRPLRNDDRVVVDKLGSKHVQDT